MIQTFWFVRLARERWGRT